MLPAMSEMNRGSVESFLAEGCGRCERYRTPDCKVHASRAALTELRAMLRETELAETMKWGSPCYTLDGANVVMLAARSEGCALSFFRGAALDDPDGELVRPGPHSRYGRLLIFASLEEVQARRARTQAFVAAAIALTRAGVRVEPGETEPIPAELQERLDDDPALAAAFDELTPGRQRSHVLHITRAKQEATRRRRVEACAAKIFAGKGWHDR